MDSGQWVVVCFLAALMVSLHVALGELVWRPMVRETLGSRGK